MKLLPCVDAAADTTDRAPMGLALAAAGPAPFAYIGQGLTLEEFEAYVLSYDFGSIPPDYVVIHHTANPAASWAPAGGAPNWDATEAGLSAAAIKDKRKRQLDGIRNYYRDTLHWGAGPHLFIDDRFIWLFTPMYDEGIHAAEGNSYKDSAGKYHYSLGVEVVGNYTALRWPAIIQRMVGGAVAILQRHLRTFDLIYKSAPPHRPELHQGSIAFHRDFNKLECPGNAVTPEFAIGVLQRAAGVGRYRVRGVAIHEAPDPNSPIALNGTAFLASGEEVVIDEVKPNGIGHLLDKRGFVPLSALERP